MTEIERLQQEVCNAIDKANDYKAENIELRVEIRQLRDSLDYWLLEVEAGKKLIASLEKK